MIKYVLLILFTFTFVQANEVSNYSELARTRRYIGGADEGDLKVQPTLYQTQGKKKKKITTEPVEGF